jgi:hypothetical protein
VAPTYYVGARRLESRQRRAALDGRRHCRIKRLYEGLNAADISARFWEQRTGRTFHRWADIVTIIGLLGPGRRQRNDIGTMLQHAVNEDRQRVDERPSR